MEGKYPFLLFNKYTRIMRYTILFLLAGFVLVSTGCNQPIDFDQEREAIIAVIKEETDAYLDRDYERLSATHVHDSLNIRLTAGADNYTFIQGWEEVGQFLMSDLTEDDLNADNITVEKTNYRMKIYPTSAFVFFNQKWISQYDEDSIELNTIQVRFLEKIEGEWKISCVSFIGTSGYMEMEETEILFD
jgi:hypothetical protein